ncbi:MAG: hypothetical protein JWM80_5459 [Cyanobacteria bacterium RYN_339]|nr:hypothetical protein [Cyanobacteria bacterium RYN_339]
MDPHEFKASEPSAQMDRPVATRKVVDCSEHPSASNCSLRISGTEDEVLSAAIAHATSPTHGHQDSPELRESIRQIMHDEHGA